MLYTTDATAQKIRVSAVHWKIAAVLPAINGQTESKGFAGPVAGVHQDVLIVAGGSNFPDSMPWYGGKKKYYDDAYVLKKASDGSLQCFKVCKLPYAIGYAAACATPQGIVCAGGENENGISNKALLLQWNAADEQLVTRYLPDLPLAVTNAAVAYHNSIIYLAGGETAGSVSSRLFSLHVNDVKAGWKQLPDVPEPVSHTVMAVQSNGHNNCLYIIGGRKKNAGGVSDLYAGVYSFDIKNNRWQQKKSLPYALSAGTGIAAGARFILLFGGDKGEVFHQTEMLIAAISAEKEQSKSAELNRQKIRLQSAHPGFSKEVLQYDTVTGEWSVNSTIPFEAPVTTTAIKWGDLVLIPNGEIKAGVRTPQILSGTLKTIKTGSK